MPTGLFSLDAMRHGLRSVVAATLSACLIATAIPGTPRAQQEDEYSRPSIDGGRGSRVEPLFKTEPPVTDIKPGERPPKGSDEEGLWMVMDEVERKLRLSGRVVNDPALQAYIERIVCKLAPDHCPDIRVYIVRTPHFNANMAPNGVMQVWTGLLLRTQNEAQLAYVLAHELAHYIRRHSLQSWRSATTTANIAAIFGALTMAAGVGYVGGIAQLIAVSSMFAYNREQEREADAIGIAMMARAGYDPHEAPKAWRGLMTERVGEDGRERTVFFASHPPTEERIETLTEAAANLHRPGAAVGKAAMERVAGPHKPAWFSDEMLRRKPQQSRRLLERLLADAPDNAFLHFVLGETHRLEYSEEGNAEAMRMFEYALTAKDPPAEVWRSMGLVSWDMGDSDAALRQFRRYLSIAPQATDREMVNSYIKELEQ